MEVSIIIVNYNVRYFLEQCIGSVLVAVRNIDSEIIVVDNNSTDDSCKILSKKHPEIQLIRNIKNVGFSKANNQGVAIAKGKYVLILNPDTIVPEDLFSKILPFANRQEKFGALGVKLIDGSGSFLPESKRNIPTLKIALSKLLNNSSNSKYYANEVAENDVGEVPVLVGAFMLIDKKVYQKLNGFDEDFFMYGEDIDLSYRIIKAGYQNLYFGKTQVLHYKGESPQNNPAYLNNFYGAMHLFYKKHFNNVFYNWIVKAGIQFFLMIKRYQRNTMAKELVSTNILYVGCDETTYQNLQNKFQTKTISIFPVCTSRVISRFDDLEKIKQIIQEKNIDELIFDNATNSYSKILFYLSELRNSKIQFKIKPKNTDFIIGSYSATSKGDIIKLV